MKKITLQLFLLFSISIISILLAVILFLTMPYSQLPNTNQNEVILSVDWNENINVDENQNRIQTLFENEKTLKTVFSKVGEQQFLLERDNSKSFSEASIYLQTKTVNEIENLKKELQIKFLKRYPNATISLDAPKNIFQYLFGNEKEELVAQISSRGSLEVPTENKVQDIQELLNGILSKILISSLP